MKKLTRHQLAQACKTHIESAQAILQTFPYDNALVLELSEIWRDLDAMGRKSRDAIRTYHRNKKLRKSAAVVNPERPVAVL